MSKKNLPIALVALLLIGGCAHRNIHWELAEIARIEAKQDPSARGRASYFESQAKRSWWDKALYGADNLLPASHRQ